jgi:hypothetical protein
MEEPEIFARGMEDLLIPLRFKQGIQRAKVKTDKSIDHITFLGRSHLYQAKCNAIAITVVVKLNIKAEGIMALQFLQALPEFIRLVNEVNGAIPARVKGQGVNVLAGKNKACRMPGAFFGHCWMM